MDLPAEEGGLGSATPTRLRGSGSSQTGRVSTRGGLASCGGVSVVLEI